MPQTADEMIHVIDYDAGNLGSIINMFRRIGVSAKLTRDPKDIEDAQKIVLPGVGAFDQCVKNLDSYGFRDVLTSRILQDRIPILGICVGFQMMSESSEEGSLRGLGWIKGTTKDMRKLAKDSPKLKFPHIGWNYIDMKHEHPVLKNLPDDPRFYFVHTYQVSCENEENVLATTEYGDLTVTASAGHDNIIGTQFHPEKSHKFGIQLFRNFVEWTPAA